MHRHYLDLHLAVDRYLEGSLEERECAAFEERLVWDQALIDEVDLAERLREGLRNSLADGLRTAETSTGADSSRMWGLWLRHSPYAAAASFILGVGLSAIFLLSSPLSVDEHRPKATPTEIVPLLTVRGANIQTVTLKEDSWTVLLADATETYDSYRVTVRPDRDGAEPVLTHENLPRTYSEVVAVSVSGAELPPGRYVLTLQGARPSNSGIRWEHISDVAFETRVHDQQ
jgi:hypothetical protein